MSNLRQVLGVALVVGATGLSLPAASTSAAALPISSGFDDAVLRDGQPAAQIEQARWVCGPYRCFWRPNYWGGPVYRGPGWGRPGWGWRGRYRRW
jgi:hypothetical protein